MKIELDGSLPMETSVSTKGKVEPFRGPNSVTRLAVTSVKVYTQHSSFAEKGIRRNMKKRQGADL